MRTVELVERKRDGGRLTAGEFSPGGTGTVVGNTDGKPLAYARIMRESLGGGASAQPANAGTVTPEG